MRTLAISLDGYTDLPSGKIANVVTYLEMAAPPPPQSGTEPADLDLRLIAHPDVAWFRGVIRTVGERWLWYSPLVMAEAELAAIICDPLMETRVLERAGVLAGISQIDRRVPGEVEIAFFGVTEPDIGKGSARWLMDRTLELAFVPGVRRVWVHTCTFDHPAAVPFYIRSGFAPFKFAIEVTDDPRLTGHVPAAAGPHVALIHPGKG